MGEAKRRRKNDINYGVNVMKINNPSPKEERKAIVVAFWRADGKYLTEQEVSTGKSIVRFWVYKGIVHTNRTDKFIRISPATETDRYKNYKDIIDSAVCDLSGKPDGVWYFQFRRGWYSEPLPDGFLEALEYKGNLMPNELLEALR